MKSKKDPQPVPGRTWKAPQPPPRGTPQSGREESNARTHAPPPRPRPGYDEFRQDARPGGSPHMRSHSSNAGNRKGFMPNTPGGDEPAAPMGAYFTQRNKPTAPPDLPSREQPPSREPPPSTQNVAPDPLRQFREKAMPSVEPRLSTPYATHGGEKLNPFESANLHRSRSTREPSQRFDSQGHVPRNGSSPNLTPHRARSFAERSSAESSKTYTGPKVDVDSSSSEDGPEMTAHSFAGSRSRPSNGTTSSQGTQQVPGSTSRPEFTRKPDKVSQFRQWMKENPDAEPPLNGFPPDGPPLRSGQAKNDTSNTTNNTARNNSNGEPSMYANPAHQFSNAKRTPSYSAKLPTVSETISSSSSSHSSQNSIYDINYLTSMKYPHLFPNRALPATPPSGVTDGPVSLTAFEEQQRTLVDQLINKRRDGPHSGSPSVPDAHYRSQHQRHVNGNHCSSSDNGNQHRDYSEAGSPTKKPRSKHLRSVHSYDPTQARDFWNDIKKIKSNTNHFDRPRFSFNVNDDTFKNTDSRPNRFTSSSAENISTKFSTEDWDGKFEAGADYFRPEQKATGVPPRSRAQSGSRSRGRSPIKVRPTDAHYMQQPQQGQEPVLESPGGTKFSPQEWADTFKPQTFAPPPAPTVPGRQTPSRKRTNPTLRPTMGGNAAVVDDGETSDEKPLFTGRKPPASPVPSPDAMDVDTPPVTNITVPQFTAPNTGAKLNVNVNTSPKRAAATQSPTDPELKVNFDDLKIQDLLSTLPPSPAPPALPTLHDGRPTIAAYEDYKSRFTKYMTSWDLYNNQFMLHLVARKNQNDGIGERRWLDEEGINTYRQGLREDNLVLKRWVEENEKHEQVVKDWVVMRESMKMKEELQNGVSAGGRQRARKKTH
jgi:hypothetical protein